MPGDRRPKRYPPTTRQLEAELFALELELQRECEARQRDRKAILKRIRRLEAAVSVSKPTVTPSES